MGCQQQSCPKNLASTINPKNNTMFYCKPGKLLVVDALYDRVEERIGFFVSLGCDPYVGAIFGSGRDEIVQIPHGDFVLALESSVPPWYKGDRIRCLWNEKEVHILRVALENYVKDK